MSKVCIFVKIKLFFIYINIYIFFLNLILLAFEEEIFIKFCEEKSIKWLSFKFENIKKSLMKNGIGKKLFGFNVHNYSSGDKLLEGKYIFTFEFCSIILCIVMIAFLFLLQLLLLMPLAT